MWKCPHCEEIIETVDYTVNTEGWESGRATIEDTLTNTNRPRPEIVDFEQDDSETCFNGSRRYCCPDCSEQIDLDDLIWVTLIHEPVINVTNEQRPTRLEQGPPPEQEAPEEYNHGIIRPQNMISTRENRFSTANSSLICKDCFHIFVFSTGSSIYEEQNINASSYECPHCGTTNTTTEFHALLEAGHYNHHDRA